VAFPVRLGVGVGPISLGMNRAEVAAVLGPPTSSVDPSSYDFLEKDDLRYLKNQIVETRRGDFGIGLIDLLFFSEKLASIRIDGKTKEVTLLDRAVNENRMQTLVDLANLNKNIYINSESYFFEDSGVVVTRTKTRKDVNYVKVIDPRFQKFRLPFDMYKPHKGPITP